MNDNLEAAGSAEPPSVATPNSDEKGGGSLATSRSADFDAEKKAIEFQELFFPEAGKLARTAIRFSFAQGFRMAQKQNGV